MNNRYIITCFLFALCSFWLLDMYSLTLGDDYGYMFTDTKHHLSNGVRVTSLSECFSTQYNHYFTTNGRYIVHVIDMIMLNIVPIFVYKLLNALMFAILWLLVFHLGFYRLRNITTCIISLSLMCLLLPDAGTILLSLHSFSINYLWTGVAVLLLLSINIEKIKSRWLLIAVLLYSCICGSLQESYSLPLCAAFVSELIISWKNYSRRHKIFWICFIVGTSVCVFAPGNINHFMQGGGFAGASILHKLSALGVTLLHTPILIVCLTLLIWLLIERPSCMKFINDNRLILFAITASIVFACFTFTSSRQLYAPSIFSIILLCRVIAKYPQIVIHHTKIITCTLLPILLFVMGGAWVLRRDIWYNHQSFLKSVFSSPSPIVCGDATIAPYNARPLLWSLLNSYAPDPWERSCFSLPFDAYSRHGLSRLAFGDSNSKYIKAVLPYSSDYIIQHTNISGRNRSNVYTPMPLDSRYGVVAVKGPQPKSVSTDDTSGVHCEIFLSDSTCYVIVPNTVKQVTLKFP